jgi:hypothetical protein
MSDQCALDASGSLLDSKDIVFYESESDTRPIPKPIASQGSQLNVPTPVHEGEYLTVLSARFTHLTCNLKGRRPQNSLIHENDSLSDDQDLDADDTEAEVSDGSDDLDEDISSLKRSNSILISVEKVCCYCPWHC